MACISRLHADAERRTKLRRIRNDDICSETIPVPCTERDQAKRCSVRRQTIDSRPVLRPLHTPIDGRQRHHHLCPTTDSPPSPRRLDERLRHGLHEHKAHQQGEQLERKHQVHDIICVGNFIRTVEARHVKVIRRVVARFCVPLDSSAINCLSRTRKASDVRRF